MRFAQAFDLAPGDVVSFIGAGGKTSLMVSLGYELAEAGWRVLATTTTSIAAEQLALFPCALPVTTDPRAISQALTEKQFVLLYAEVTGGKVYGPGLEWARRVVDSVDSDILLVEADQADGLPFKAPLADEPQIPPGTSLVVAVASLRALGKRLHRDNIYNPGAMTAKYGFAANSPVKSPWLAQVLRDEELGLRGIPPSARVMVFLNHTPERGYVRGRARMIARLSLQSERIKAVALGSVRGAEPVFELQRSLGALVLAADDGALRGTSGGTLANLTEQLMRSRIDHIRLVTGRGARELRRELKPLGVATAHNRAWKKGGLVSTLRAGFESLPEHVSAALLVPGCAAPIQPRLIFQLMSAYARCDGDFIAPRQHRQNLRVLLVARPYWRDMLNLPCHCDFDGIIRHFEAHIAMLELDARGIVTGMRPAAKDRQRWTAKVRDRGL